MMILEIVLGLLVITEGYVIWNLNKKTELLETWVENFSNTIQTIQSPAMLISFAHVNGQLLCHHGHLR